MLKHIHTAMKIRGRLFFHLNSYILFSILTHHFKTYIANLSLKPDITAEGLYIRTICLAIDKRKCE